jgi:hypothetical protein
LWFGWAFCLTVTDGSDGGKRFERSRLGSYNSHVVRITICSRRVRNSPGFRGLITAFTAPIFGNFSDHFDTRFGKRKPLIVLGIVLAILAWIGEYFNHLLHTSVDSLVKVYRSPPHPGCTGYCGLALRGRPFLLVFVRCTSRLLLRLCVAFLSKY